MASKRSSQEAEDASVLTVSTHDALGSDGRAVARAEDGRIVFVDKAAPNEEVAARVTKAHKRFIEASVESIVKPSSERVEPRCAYFGTCGGCDTQHVSYDAQLRSKVRALSDALQRLAGLDLEQTTIEPPWTSSPYGYRNRAKLTASKSGGIGFLARRSHDVIDVEACPVLDEAAQRGLAHIRGRMASTDGEARILGCPDGRVLIWTSSAVDDVEPDPQVVLVGGDESVEVQDALGTLHVSPKTFSQSNPAGNEALAETLMAWLSERDFGSAVELFSGNGNLTRAIAKVVPTVVCFEGEARSVAMAKAVVGPSVTVHRQDVTTALKSAVRAKQAWDVAVIDPPRTGCPKGLISRLVKVAPRVFYVSCALGTFARDVRAFGQEGFRLDRVRLFDFYPQTAGVEILGELSLGEPNRLQ